LLPPSLGHTILVVDDDPQFRELCTTVLRFHGFGVMTASDGLHALHAIERRRPALILLDLNMPRVDGWSVLRELAANPSTRSIPVIVVTGAEVGHAVDQAAAILRKPIGPDQVVPIVERHLSVA
jgi:CheY-like chemotaxis protein